MTAAPLPPGKLTFIDLVGAPLEGGTVGFYEPGGLTPRDTWQDYGQTTLNDNPLTLDERGQCVVWGAGRYRQIVKDSLGNLIWDQETFVLPGSSLPYEVGFYFPDAPNASDIIFVFNFTQSVVFETNFPGAFGSVNTTPSAETVLDVRLNGASTIGSITVSIGGVVTFASAISNPSFSPGDQLAVRVQAGGANGLAGVAATFLGTSSS